MKKNFNNKMTLIEIIDESVKVFGEEGHISFHPHLWFIALQDLEFTDKITLVIRKEDILPGQMAEYKAIKLYVSSDPTPGTVYEDRILKAMVALQHPELLEFT